MKQSQNETYASLHRMQVSAIGTEYGLNEEGVKRLTCADTTDPTFLASGGNLIVRASMIADERTGAAWHLPENQEVVMRNTGETMPTIPDNIVVGEN